VHEHGAWLAAAARHHAHERAAASLALRWELQLLGQQRRRDEARGIEAEQVELHFERWSLAHHPAEQVRAQRDGREVARLLRIEDKLGNRATQLSGGQMQRVAIGRALVRRPSIYLMDEPLSSLDAKLRSELRVELKRVQEQLGATILYVTHDQTEAMTLATRIGVIEQGRLIQIGSPREIYENPVSAYVAGRLGSPGINLLPLSLAPQLAAPAGATTVGARTEHLRIRRAEAGTGAVTGRVDWVEHLGDQNHLHVTVGDRSLVTLSDPDSGLDRGDTVAIDFVRPLFFDAGGARVQAG
jgi:multiple sugar transport system ATP-binding protein